MKKAYKRKNEKGITLISLIIIIVILLVLAGITIVNLTGENGLISRAKQATKNYETNQAKEKLELAIVDLKVDKEGKGENLTKEDLPKINNDEIDVGNTEKFPVEIICQKYKFSVDENFIVTYVGEAEGTIITYTTEPESYTNKDEIKILIKASNPKGIKTIEYPDGDRLQVVEEKTEVGIDYKVSKNGSYTFKVIDNEDKEVTKDVVIDLIDKLPPIDFTPEVEKDGENITIKENAQDAEATEESTKSGIEKYEYYITNESNVTTKYDINKIENLALGTYQVYIIAYDKAGNSKQSSTIEVKISMQFGEVATGAMQSLAIDKSGNLWIWGDNSEGQLGNGTTTNSYVPIKVKEGIKFKKIASGWKHCLAIDEEGNLWTWGYNRYGQLGNGTTTNSTVPIQIKEGTKFKKIAGGDCHSLAIDEEGNLWAWGNNGYGQLGDGTTTDSAVPVQIKEGRKFKEIATGQGSWSLAIDEEGNLWTWGYNYLGELGNGTTTDSTVPIQIKEGTKFKKIAGGNLHSLAIDEEGHLWTWGYGKYGRLGNGGETNSLVPIQIKEDIKFKEIEGGSEHSVAIDEEGNLWVFGWNSSGQLGTGNTTTSYVPIKVKKENKFEKVSAYVHNLALDIDGNLWTWGANKQGQLGNGTTNGSGVPKMIN